MLKDKYKIIDVDMSSDTQYAYKTQRDFGGNLVYVKLAEFNDGRHITLNFDNDFHVMISVDITILKAFELGEKAEVTALKIGKYIEDCWLNKIKTL